MDPLLQALALATLAGATMPLGALLGRIERIRPRWLENELRLSVIAFGGGVLLAAVALVLVPEGVRRLPVSGIAASFAAGGLVFLAVDRALAQSGWRASQLAAMLLDFVPEAMALGALLATGEDAGLLLAILIALQNLPEGFNAYREITSDGTQSPRTTILSFTFLVVLGPL